MTPGANITLVTVGVHDTGRWTVGAPATGIQAASTRRMKIITIVTTLGANTMLVMAGVRVTGRRVGGAERTSVTTTATKRNGSVTPSSML